MMQLARMFITFCFNHVPWLVQRMHHLWPPLSPKGRLPNRQPSGAACVGIFSSQRNSHLHLVAVGSADASTPSVTVHSREGTGWRWPVALIVRPVHAGPVMWRDDGKMKGKQPATLRTLHPCWCHVLAPLVLRKGERWTQMWWLHSTRSMKCWTRCNEMLRWRKLPLRLVVKNVSFASFMNDLCRASCKRFISTMDSICVFCYMEHMTFIAMVTLAVHITNFIQWRVSRIMHQRLNNSSESMNIAFLFLLQSNWYSNLLIIYTIEYLYFILAQSEVTMISLQQFHFRVLVAWCGLLGAFVAYGKKVLIGWYYCHSILWYAISIMFAIGLVYCKRKIGIKTQLKASEINCFYFGYSKNSFH